MTSWDEQLDRFEAHLAKQRRVLADGRPEDVEAFLPDVAGPLPAHLAGRAAVLAQQAEALTNELTAATASAVRQLQLVTAMKGSIQPTSSYVDQRG